MHIGLTEIVIFLNTQNTSRPSAALRTTHNDKAIVDIRYFPWSDIVLAAASNLCCHLVWRSWKVSWLGCSATPVYLLKRRLYQDAVRYGVTRRLVMKMPTICVARKQCFTLTMDRSFILVAAVRRSFSDDTTIRCVLPFWGRSLMNEWMDRLYQRRLDNFYIILLLLFRAFI